MSKNFETTSIADIERHMVRLLKTIRCEHERRQAQEDMWDEFDAHFVITKLIPFLEKMETTDIKETIAFWEKAMIGEAFFIGGERGQRVGAEAAQRMIKEARAYANNQQRVFAPWLDDVEPEEGD